MNRRVAAVKLLLDKRKPIQSKSGRMKIGIQELSPRQRVLRAIRLEEPDRVPLFFTVTPQVAALLSRHLGIADYTVADSPLSQNRISYHELLLELGNDVAGIGACSPRGNPTRELESGLLTNEWGVKYRTVGYYSEMVAHPLAEAESLADVDGYAFPDPHAPGRFDLARQVVERYGERYAICGDLECTILEASWYLTGFQKFLIDLSLEKDYVFALLDRVMDYSIEVGRELLRIGADILWLGDDLGSQQGMLLSPAMWRRHFKERMRKVIQSLKSADPRVKIAYHSCGSYYPVIPELLEIGVDILNALQPNARDMDLARLKEQFGEKAVFFGGLDTQEVLPFGSVRDVEEEIKRVIQAAARGGGLILAGAHNIQPDVSVEKLVSIFDFSKRHGTYPV
jgi:uroporphyrinogen decarboxylase